MSFLPFFKQASNAHAQALAGTTAKAPLKFLAGTNTTTPVTGALEYDGTSLQFTPFADRRTVILSNGPVTSDVTVGNTTTETTIYSENLSANTLTTGHRILLKDFGGFYSTQNASDTFTYRVKIGSATIISGTSTAKNVTNAGFTFNFMSTVRASGVTGSIIANMIIVLDNQAVTSGTTATTTIDTTVNNTLAVTIQWGVANPSNTLTLTQGHIEFVD